MRKFTLFLIVLLAYSLNAQSDDRERLRQVNRELTAHYQSGEFDAALESATEGLELSLKLFGPETNETALAYSDLGMVLSKLNRSKESVKNLRLAISIYEKLPSKKGIELIATYQRMGTAQMLGGMDKNAERSYLKAIEIAEERNGIQSGESFSPTLNLANFYARSKKFTLAFEYYLKCYELVRKNFSRGGEEVLQIQDSMVCLVNGIAGAEKEKQFHKALSARDGNDVPVNTGSVINGKAVSLPKPKYPAAARAKRLGGRVVVRVTVDEQGNVVEAHAVCGHPLLGNETVEAARMAKFTPTFLDNAAVKVMGLITYNFIP